MKLKLLIFTIMVSFAMGLSAQKKKVAVVTFYVNKHIDFTGLGGTAGLAAGMASLVEDPNFDLTSVLNNFHDVFFNEYAASFPFELVPEEVVTGNEAYQNYQAFGGETEDEDQHKFFQRFTTYEGYKPMQEYILVKEKRNELQMLEIFGDQVDGVMFVYLDYSFVRKAMGFGAGIEAYARMKLWNKEGKKVFKVNEFATSKKTVPMLAGVPVMEIEKLLPLCESASAELIEDLGKRLKKIASKADKKL